MQVSQVTEDGKTYIQIAKKLEAGISQGNSVRYEIAKTFDEQPHPYLVQEKVDSFLMGAKYMKEFLAKKG